MNQFLIPNGRIDQLLSGEENEMQNDKSEKQEIDGADDGADDRAGGELLAAIEKQPIQNEDEGISKPNDIPDQHLEMESSSSLEKAESPNSTDDAECQNHFESPLHYTQETGHLDEKIEETNKCNNEAFIDDSRQTMNRNWDQVDEENSSEDACSLESLVMPEDLPQELETNQQQASMVHYQLKEKAEAFHKRRCSPRTRDRLQESHVHRSPPVWGTAAYAKLWDMALELGKANQNATPPLEHLDLNSMENCPSSNDCQRVNNINGENRTNWDAVSTSENALDSQTMAIVPNLDQLDMRADSVLLLSEGTLASVERNSFDDQPSDSDDESEWELTFDETDPLERYTITTTGSGRKL